MKKFLPYILILTAVVGIGLSIPASRADAQATATTGACWYRGAIQGSALGLTPVIDPTRCLGTWQAPGAPIPPPPNGPPPGTVVTPGTTVEDPCASVGTGKPGDPEYDACKKVEANNGNPAATPSTNQSAFDKAVGGTQCWVGFSNGGLSPQGCLLQFVYWTFYTLGAWLLAITASFFNYFIKITLGPELLKSDFVSHAWGVVRDLSNIFFILILLYIAVKIILDLGGSEAKKMIAKVIIIALLINFSMFFTHVVIDSSNILALVFYNKLNTVNEKNPNKAEQLIDYATGQKDLAGGLTQSFNPVYQLQAPFYRDAGIIDINGKVVQEAAPTGMLIGITVIAGAIMLFAAYALFISALSFLGRLIELFVLIIFSPFAFMSFTIPILGHVEYIGWDAWIKRLFKTAFMAPIFMFFLYFIFLLLGESEGKNMFTDSLKGKGVVRTLLSIIIPAMVVLILLLKATEFAKKGSGKFGEVLTKVGGQVGGLATGLALGAATGGAGFALRAGVGGVGGYAANKLASGANKLGDTKWGNRLGMNKLASGLTSVGAAAQKSSFDIRGTDLGKAFASATGVKLGEAQKGGIEQARKDKVEKRMKRAEGLKVREDEKLKQQLNKTEADLQKLLNDNFKELNEFDKLIEKKREALRDVTARFGGGSPEAKMAGLELQNLKDRKKALKDGVNYAGDKDIQGNVTGANAKNYSGVNAGTYVDGNGVTQTRTINHIEDIELRDRKDAIEQENRRRTTAFANRTAKWGRWSSTANKEARHKIIMGSKIETKK